jgi:hypothetical protein
MKTILPFILILFSLNTAHARFGETYEACVARYGDPVDDDTSTGLTVFRKNGIGVGIRFNAKGQADYLTYAADGIERKQEINRDEAVTLVELNLGADLRFEEMKGGAQKWSHRKTYAYGVLFPNGLLVITDAVGLERFSNDQKAATKSKMSGF